MTTHELNPTSLQCQYFLSAFLAMEPTDFLISLSRKCACGLITESLQRFIWDHCISKADGKCYSPYIKNFMKKIINAVESEHGVVLDEFYEQYACYMTSMKEGHLIKENLRVLKQISFFYPKRTSIDCLGQTKSMKLKVSLQSSLNMLEGDTGCAIWPSSLFMSEFILSFPEIFYGKSCFEVGSGVGLVGVCLAHVKASKVILTDGDLSTLANMKSNLELNQLSVTTNLLESTIQDPKLVEYIHLPWESASESELQKIMPDLILGADVIYDPLYFPGLIRILTILLDRRNCTTYSSEPCGPLAYIASVIRNINTFNRFLQLAEQANLAVVDVTDKFKLIDFLPYMKSYNRSSIRLLTLSSTCMQ